MSQDIKRKRLKRNSLRASGDARTFLLRMAADQERADRIRALYESRPDLTWGRIAEHVGVKERSAWEWGRTGGIDYENVPALAELFEVDVDFIWRGPANIDTPDLMEAARADQLEEVSKSFDERVTEIEERQKHLVETVDKIYALVRRLVREGVPAPPADVGRRAAGVTPTPPTGQPERRRGAAGYRRDTA